MATVILLDQSGNEVPVHTVLAFVNNVYSKGYLPKTGSIEANYAYLINELAQPSDSALDHVTLAELEERLAQLPGGSAAVSSVNSQTGAVILSATDVGALPVSSRGAADGVAALGPDGLVPATQLPPSTGGGGAVDSVNSQTGVVVLDAADVGAATPTYVDDGDTAAKARANHTGTQSLDTTTDSGTRVAMTPAERTKLTGVAAGATANSSDATLLARANHTGTQSLDTTTDSGTRVAMTPAERTKLTGVATGATANSSDATLLARANHTGVQVSATLSDLTETVQDIVAAFVAAGTGMAKTYDDATNTLTLTATGGGGSTDPEVVRDTIGSALVQGAGINIVLNDAGDTITISSTAVLPTRQVLAGTGLSGGGDLSADRTFSVVFGTTAGTAVEGNDARLSDARTPTAHTHTASQLSDSTATGRSVVTAADAAAARTAIGAGTSNLAIGTTSTTAKAGDYAPPSDAAAATPSMRTLGTGATQAAAGNDARLSDARTPTTHTHTASQLSDSTVTGRSVIMATDAAAARAAIGAGTSNLALGTTSTTAKAGDYAPPSDAAAATPSMRTLGTGATQAAAGNDARLSDARTPTTHTHTASQLSDSTATGRSVVTAADAAAARTAIGAGTSNLAIGTTGTTAKAGDYQPTAANISDSTATGRSVLTAASAPAARTAIGAGVVDSSDASILNIVRITQAAYDALGTKVATTMYAIVG